MFMTGINYTNELTEAEWLHDLRTTNAKRAKGALRFDGGYCCLGRACVKDKRIKADGETGYVIEIDGEPGHINSSSMKVWRLKVGHVQVFTWMSRYQANLCATANDKIGMSFPEIADWWEAGQPVDSDRLPMRVTPGA